LKDAALADDVDAAKPMALVSTPDESHPSSKHYVPPRELKRLMMAIVLVAACAELAYTTVNISAMQPFIRAHHLPEEWIGIAAFCFIFFEGVMKSPFGLLGDKVGRRILILAGPSVSIVTCLITPHVVNPYLLITLRILDGFGAAALWPAAFSLIGDHVPERRRSQAMSYFNLAYLLGLALGPLLGGSVNELSRKYLHLSFVDSKSTSFYVAACLFAITTVVAMLYVPNVKPVKHVHVEGAEGGLDVHSFTAMLGRMPMTLLMTFTVFLGIGLIMAYVKDFTVGYFGFTETHFGALLIGPALIIAALSVPLGTLGDKIGKAKAVKIGIGLCALSYWLVLAHFTEWTLVLGGGAVGVGFVIAFPAWMALVSALCDTSQRGAAIGAVGTAQGLGAIIGVGVCSLIYRFGPFKIGPITVPHHGLPFLCCGIMLAISFVLAVSTVKDPDRPKDS
jgi:DHA1 family multidrug resistance protein-like MFS transporter